MAFAVNSVPTKEWLYLHLDARNFTLPPTSLEQVVITLVSRSVVIEMHVFLRSCIGSLYTNSFIKQPSMKAFWIRLACSPGTVLPFQLFLDCFSGFCTKICAKPENKKKVAVLVRWREKHS